MQKCGSAEEGPSCPIVSNSHASPCWSAIFTRREKPWWAFCTEVDPTLTSTYHAKIVAQQACVVKKIILCSLSMCEACASYWCF